MNGVRRVLGPLVLLALAGCHRGPGSPHPAARSPGALPPSSAGFLLPGSAFEPYGPCPRATDPRIPAGSGCAFVVQGDLDGDRRPDLLFSYAALGASGRARSWFLRAVLASGRATSLEVPQPSQLEVLGMADVNGDGRQEGLVQLDQGASTSFVGIYTLDGRRALVPVTEDGDGPLRFGLNGSVTHGDGGGCATGTDGKPRLVIRSVERTNEGPYDAVVKTYTWDGTSVRLAGTERGVIDAGDGSDPSLRPFYEFTCGSLRLS